MCRHRHRRGRVEHSLVTCQSNVHADDMRRARRWGRQCLMHPFDPPEIECLQRCLARAGQSAPAGWLTLRLGELAIGRVSPDRVPLLLTVWPELQVSSDSLLWNDHADCALAREARIAQVALLLRQLGVLHGWRDELFDCEAPVSDPLQSRGERLFRLERSVFRYFGLMSRAVHVNGQREDGQWLCGRRALSKAIDPGRLDNLAAGGLTSGESLQACAMRELDEEAGIPTEHSAGMQWIGGLRSTRVEPEGLHDEVLHMARLRLPVHFVPRNRDGEVSEFLCLSDTELLRRLAADEFTVDAAAVMAWELLGAPTSGEFP